MRSILCFLCILLFIPAPLVPPPLSVPPPLPPPPLPKESPVLYQWPMVEEDFLELSSPYGERNPEDIGGYGDDFHDGIDLYGTWLARILSISDGMVKEHYPPPDEKWKGHPVLGGYIVISHVDGSESRYGHLSKTFIHEGDKVQSGQLVGRQGNTGTWEGKLYPSHLHFELYIDGEQVNPLKYLEVPDEFSTRY